MFGGYPPTAIGYPPTAIGYTPTAIGYPPTAISYPPAAIIGRIGHSEFFFIFFIMATPDSGIVHCLHNSMVPHIATPRCLFWWDFRPWLTLLFPASAWLSRTVLCCCVCRAQPRACLSTRWVLSAVLPALLGPRLCLRKGRRGVALNWSSSEMSPGPKKALYAEQSNQQTNIRVVAQDGLTVKRPCPGGGGGMHNKYRVAQYT